MTQAPYPEDDAKLPNGLHVLQVYTELKNGSRNVSLVVRNGTSRAIYVSHSRSHLGHWMNNSGTSTAPCTCTLDPPV